jgi:hypothetical protein
VGRTAGGCTPLVHLSLLCSQQPRVVRQASSVGGLLYSPAHLEGMLGAATQLFQRGSQLYFPVGRELSLARGGPTRAVDGVQ